MGREAGKQRVRNAQGQATQEQILDTAGKVFAEKGYEGASLRDISEESGIGLSSIMYHFRSKEELYLRTIRHFVIRNANLNEHFRFLAEVDYSQPQKIADALRDVIRSFLGAIHGQAKTPYMNELYARIMVESNMAALGMLLECFVPVQEQLPQVVKRIRPDFTDADVAFWVQLLWAQLQYTVMGRKLILYDMKLGDEYPEAYLDEAAWRFARYCCLPLGLPEPGRTG